MPCQDSSSSITLKLDGHERFLSFEFAKITCGRPVEAQTGYQRYCVGKTLSEILDIPYAQAAQILNAHEEEQRFILFLEWDALRSAIAQYLGHEDERIDRERCHISSVDQTEDGVEVAMIILPPKDMPKIPPCGIGDKK